MLIRIFQLKGSNELFSWFLLENTLVRWGEMMSFNVKTFNIYLFALTQYWKFKRICESEEEENIRDEVYNLLYSFSHNRFYDFISKPEIRVLILALKEEYSIEEFVNLITPSNFRTYKAHIETIFRLITQS